MLKRLLVMFTVMAALLIWAKPAAAYDSYPCTYSGRYARLPYACPVVWPSTGRIPVYLYANGASTVVDYLHTWSGTQYFACEGVGTRYTRGSATNIWWAWTQGDGGKWGWVSEVFFKGGLNDEPDRGLPSCRTPLRPGQ